MIKLLLIHLVVFIEGVRVRIRNTMAILQLLIKAEIYKMGDGLKILNSTPPSELS